MDIDRLLKVKETASYIQLHPATVYRMAKNNELPITPVGKRGIRFRASDLDNWLSARTSRPFSMELAGPEICLEGYDKLQLKGVKMSPKGKIWNYPFGSVYLRRTKDGKERWYLYYRVDGKRVRRAVRGAQSRADALKVLQVAVADAFRGKHGFEKKGQRCLFKDFAREFLERYSKVNKRSWRSDVSIVNKLNLYFGDKYLEEIRPEEVEGFKSARLEEGRTRSKVNRDLSLLKKMFNVAIDWNRLETSPMTKVRLFPEKDNLKERILTDEEETSLLKACPPYLRSIVITALYTGMRRGEILSLKWNQVDLEKDIITVKRTKSGKDRLVPIGESLKGILRLLRSENSSSEHVFLYPPTKKPFTDIKKSFQTAVRKAKVQGLRFHDLRHTYASRLIARGTDIITVRDLLGHYSVEVTQRYTHSNQAQKRQAVDALESQTKQIQKDVHMVSTPQELLSANYLNAIN